jgi:hypothetical protein
MQTCVTKAAGVLVVVKVVKVLTGSAAVEVNVDGMKNSMGRANLGKEVRVGGVWVLG